MEAVLRAVSDRRMARSAPSARVRRHPARQDVAAAVRRRGRVGADRVRLHPPQVAGAEPLPDRTGRRRRGARGRRPGAVAGARRADELDRAPLERGGGRVDRRVRDPDRRESRRRRQRGGRPAAPVCDAARPLRPADQAARRRSPNPLVRAADRDRRSAERARVRARHERRVRRPSARAIDPSPQTNRPVQTARTWAGS